MITMAKFRADRVSVPNGCQPVCFMSRDVLVNFVQQNDVDGGRFSRPSQLNPYWVCLGVKIYEVARCEGFYAMTVVTST